MLLRSLTKHVKDQNWFAVALDFIIVVFGVFIGIQVSNWNDERVLVQTERKYIERLREDLASNHDDVTQRIAYFTQVRNHGLQALIALEKPQETLGEAFLIDIYQASQILGRKFGTDTYDEILSVGASEAISDVAVRKRLANFYGSIQAQLSTLEATTPYRAKVRGHLPYAASRAIRSACDDIVETSADGKPTISPKRTPVTANVAPALRSGAAVP